MIVGQLYIPQEWTGNECTANDSLSARSKHWSIIFPALNCYLSLNCSLLTVKCFTFLSSLELLRLHLGVKKCSTMAEIADFLCVCWEVHATGCHRLPVLSVWRCQLVCLPLWKLTKAWKIEWYHYWLLETHRSGNAKLLNLWLWKRN